MINDAIEEISYSALDYRVIPWSTVSIQNNDTDITSYRQNIIGGKYRQWNANEVIHLTMMDIDGKVYSFSPALSAMNVITTLSLIKDYNGYLFENGGEPDLMFVFPEEMSESPQIESFKRMMQEKKKNINKHGHMVITGQCDIKRVNEGNKDMEFRLLAIQYVGILAFAYNMPISRIKSIIGSEVSGGGDDLSDSGYWRSISSMQKYIEDTFNETIFIPNFGVEFKFKKSYKQDEVREAQAKMFNVQVLQNMAGGLKLKPKKDYIKQVLSLEEDDVDWDEWEKLSAMDIPAPGGQSAQAPNKDLFKNETQLANDDKKRKSSSEKVNVR